MATDDHGACKNCGYNLNGPRVYDHFLEEYGDPVKACLLYTSPSPRDS